MAYESVLLNKVIDINKIVTIHYFEYMSNFSFYGESHDFWEFLYVDKGEINVTADKSTYTLKKDEIIFHEPNEFHNVKANGHIAPNLVVISFECTSKAMDFFKKKRFKITENERNFLANIILEAKNSFMPPFDNPYVEHLTRNNASIFGSEQLIKMNLEAFLIYLIRREKEKKIVPEPALQLKKKSNLELYKQINLYLNKNLSCHLSIDQIAKDNLISRSQLQKIFQEQTQEGVIEHFSKMKIDTAKQLIRNNIYNFTEIANQLGYSSVHYFSRQFKKITGMSPSEYSASVKGLSEHPSPK
ncbi:AraC family transcriptional regulator [Velocimicrobium porci]|uniref:AraC family transcriptional regulator n=1 Tax=Velocimicrobium porci TaxID=2606634 RepID=A0A6L5XUR7_9FIRM|nr:helix-turn-helix domain-containing protein [Velocimicrobium porci]MSS62339.1 AraC family transcriptional regulator [Velocimicrobium porci]